MGKEGAGRRFQAKPANRGENPAAEPQQPESAEAHARPGRRRRQNQADQLAKLREMLKNAESLGDGRISSADAGKCQELQGLLGAMPGRGCLDRAWITASRARRFFATSPPSPPRPAGARSWFFATADRPPGERWSAKTDTSSPRPARSTASWPAGSAPASCRQPWSRSKTEHDLALLKVDANDLVPITWADGDPPRARQLADHARPGERRPRARRRQHSGPRHSRRAEDSAPQSGHHRRDARSDGQGRPRPRGHARICPRPRPA